MQPSFSAQKFKSPDAKKQWHEVSLGTRPVEDMKCAPGAFSDLKVCTRPVGSGDRAIGELTADGVVYHYFQDRLFRIDIAFSNDEIASELSTVLHAQYGPGMWDAGEGKESWKGAQIFISFARTLRKPGAQLSYQYIPLLEDVDRGREKAGGERMQRIANDL